MCCPISRHTSLNDRQVKYGGQIEQVETVIEMTAVRLKNEQTVKKRGMPVWSLLRANANFRMSVFNCCRRWRRGGHWRNEVCEVFHFTRSPFTGWLQKVSTKAHTHTDTSESSHLGLVWLLQSGLSMRRISTSSAVDKWPFGTHSNCKALKKASSADQGVYADWLISQSKLHFKTGQLMANTTPYR